MEQVYWHCSSKGSEGRTHVCELKSVLVIFLVAVTKCLTEKAEHHGGKAQLWESLSPHCQKGEVLTRKQIAQVGTSSRYIFKHHTQIFTSASEITLAKGSIAS